ncbi:MAG: hypothetical protein HZB92_08090 [Euryarchaeota archaeon]|nr:hypothetical protein [Euryarchaeota archaeon]
MSANSYTVPATGYDSTDTLGALDLWNDYHVSAASGKKISYSFAVQGSGTIKVLFVKGSTFTLNSQYLVVYSRDTPTTSYSGTFSVGSDDGTQFTIVVTSDLTQNVTYTAKITVADTPVTDYLLGAGILVGIIVVVVIIGAFLRGRKKKASQAPSHAPQQHIPPPPAR